MTLGEKALIEDGWVKRSDGLWQDAHGWVCPLEEALEEYVREHGENPPE